MDYKSVTSQIHQYNKEAGTMPNIKLVEYERIAYVKEMENYLQKLKSMPNHEAIQKSRINLENCHIIQKNGELSEQYNSSRIYSEE